ncbi:MAG: response regulator transcription factor [Sulfurospirillum sp.]
MDKIFLEKLKTLTLLYAEDEEGIRKKVSDSLRYYVKEVIEAQNGQEALKLYKEYKPDILFTDIMMPILDGIELVRAIRKGDNKTPIAIITAHTDKEYLLRAVDLHLEQYIIKPINLTDLKNTLQKCVDVISKNRALIRDLPGEYSYDFDSKILTCGDKVIKLSKKEIAFFELLIQNRYRVVTYSELQNYIWQDEIMSDDALKSLVKNIRQKFPKDYIKNLSGIGYRLNDQIS